MKVKELGLPGKIVAEFESSTHQGLIYYVLELPNGSLQCGCPGYLSAQKCGRVCWHIIAYENQER